jgi:trigger factor
MSETSLATATPEETFAYPIRVEDAGPATKKIVVEIPRERIDAKLAADFKEVRSTVTLPGFRAGHAPMALIKKKFTDEIKAQVLRNLISESYGQAVEGNGLDVLGQPEFEDEKAVASLPETGGLSYTLIVELKPVITLPELKGLDVAKPKIEVTDANVDQAMSNLREQQGQLVPVEDAAQLKDTLVGDFHLKLDGNVIGHQHGAQLTVGDGRVSGIEIPELGSKLVGVKPGETRVLEADVPVTFPQPELAGKHVQIEIKVNDIKRLELATIDADFLESLGFRNEGELRDALREQLVERIDYDVAEAMRNQVRKYLAERVQIELPSKLTQRQSDRVVNRRAMDLLTKGISRQQLEANIEQLRQGAPEEAAAELRMFFILQKIADERSIEVDESELNGRIALMAALRGERPEKLKQQMSKDGSLSNLYLQMREQAALDSIIADATVSDVDLTTTNAAIGTPGETATPGHTA